MPSTPINSYMHVLKTSWKFNVRLGFAQKRPRQTDRKIKYFEIKIELTSHHNTLKCQTLQIAKLSFSQHDIAKDISVI